MGSPGLLKRLRQTADHLLRGRQLLGEGLLGGLQIPGQPALLAYLGKAKPINPCEAETVDRQANRALVA